MKNENLGVFYFVKKSEKKYTITEALFSENFEKKRQFLKNKFYLQDFRSKKTPTKKRQFLKTWCFFAEKTPKKTPKKNAFLTTIGGGSK